jgi:hypothetical protein
MPLDWRLISGGTLQSLDLEELIAEVIRAGYQKLA